MDVYLATLLLGVLALVIGLIVFGGTTLVYFLDQRRVDPPVQVPHPVPAVGEGLPRRAGSRPEPRDRSFPHDRAA